MSKRKCHIVHIRDSSGVFGAERVILTLAKNIDQVRFSFTLLCLRRKDGRSEALVSISRQKGINVLTVDVHGRFDVKAIRSIRKVLLENSVDIVHSHDFKSDFYALVSSLGTGIKRVTTAHGSTKDSLLKRIYLYFNEKLVYSLFDQIVAVSEELSTQLNQRGVPLSKIQVIQNGLDFSLLENEIQLNKNTIPINIPAGNKVFAVIGRLFPDKGHRYFLEAFAAIKKEYPAVSGLIVGDGPSMSEVRHQVNTLNLTDSVILCGVRSDMKTIYELLDFLVISSLREGLPYVLLEAMASRVPVVATSVGDISFLIEDRKTGFLVAAGDAQALEKKMRELLDNPRHVAEMREAAYAHVTNKYSADMMVSEIEKLYTKLLIGKIL